MLAQQKARWTASGGRGAADRARARPRAGPSRPAAVARIVFVVSLGVVLMAGACGQPPAPPETGTASPGTSGPAGDTRHGTVIGHLTAGPCANAEPTGQGSCRLPAVGNANIVFIPSAGGAAVITATDSVTGEYRVDLAAGRYTVRVEGHVFNVSNRGETRTVEVHTGLATTLDLVVDTGIRGPAATGPATT